MLSEKLREYGVVGAGGAGFPTYVKAQSQVEFMIANGAECEPLIHKDAELMKHFPAEILAGMTSMMDATGARAGQVRHQDEECGIARSAQAQPEGPAHRVRDAGRFLPVGRRIRIGVHGHRAPDSAGGHSAAGGLRGEQRGDAVQRAPGAARAFR